MNKAIAIGVTTFAMAMLVSIVAAAGTNQYGTNFPISSSGYCHGAFANTNGNFSSLGTSGGAALIGGGVPEGPGAAGYDNSAVSGDCTLPSGQ
jgi:hypothetical protein